MATSGILYVVFLLPVIFSIVFGSVVMADVLQKPDRELNMWPIEKFGSSHDNSVKIIGLAQQYTPDTPVKIQVSVDDPSLDCGDLYVTVYSTKDEVIVQNGFFQQCFLKNNSMLPINDEFSEIIDIPGQYVLVVEISDKDQRHKISQSEKFTVK